MQSIECRQRQKSLQHFDVEAQADDERTKQHPTQFAGFGSVDECPRCQQKCEDWRSIHGVVTVGGNEDRCDRHDEGGNNTRQLAHVFFNHAVQQSNAEDTCKDIGRPSAENALRGNV